MSFSSDVKEELAKQLNKSRHCQIAELAAIFAFQGKIATENKNGGLGFWFLPVFLIAIFVPIILNFYKSLKIKNSK